MTGDEAEAMYERSIEDGFVAHHLDRALTDNIAAEIQRPRRIVGDAMMLKLYKRDGDQMRYWEAWKDGRSVVVHWGVVGDKGKTRTVPLATGQSDSEVIADLSAKPREDGYAEIDVDDHATVVVQYRTETWGSVEDLDQRHHVEDILNQCLGWTGNGHCDGGDIGSGTINAWSFAVVPVVAGRTIVEALRKANLLDGAIIDYSQPGEDDFTVVWPQDYRGEFSIV